MEYSLQRERGVRERRGERERGERGGREKRDQRERGRETEIERE